MDRTLEVLAAEVREQDKLYAAGDVTKAFWLGQQARLREMREIDPSLSMAGMGRLIGKGDDWVSQVLKWDPMAIGTPFPVKPTQTVEARARRAAKKVLASAAEDELGALVEGLEREQRLALERVVHESLVSRTVKKGSKRQRRDLVRWADDGAAAWWSAAEQLTDEGVSVPEGQQRESLLLSIRATRTFIDAVERVLNNEITVEQFADELEDLDTVKEMLGT